jgi:hypothetical protein
MTSKFLFTNQWLSDSYILAFIVKDVWNILSHVCRNILSVMMCDKISEPNVCIDLSFVSAFRQRAESRARGRYE